VVGARQGVVVAVEDRSHAPTVQRLAIVPLVQGSTPVGSPGIGPPPRARLFLVGVLGLPVALVLAAAIEGALRAAGSEGAVPDAFFAAVAGLTPVLALGLLVQLLTALTGRTRNLLREVRRFDEEMSADPPQLVEESHRDRMAAWVGARLFMNAVVPFGAGVTLQLVVTEAVAVTCLAAGIDERSVALALGAELLALFVYLVLFGRILGALTMPRRRSESPA
jgi:hypothetical protein